MPTVTVIPSSCARSSNASRSSSPQVLNEFPPAALDRLEVHAAAAPFDDIRPAVAQQLVGGAVPLNLDDRGSAVAGNHGDRPEHGQKREKNGLREDALTQNRDSGGANWTKNANKKRRREGEATAELQGSAVASPSQ